MTLLRFFLVIFVLIISTVLFRRAAGTLKLTGLNMISTIYYYVLIFNLLGSSLIYLGLRGHYLVQKVKVAATFDATYYSVAYTVILFPLTIIVVRLICANISRIKPIESFISAPVLFSRNMIKIQRIVLFLICICTLATVYVFLYLGYFPALEMIRRGNMSFLRQSGSRYFQGNVYIKNLLMLALTPYLAYFSYIYFKITRSQVWKAYFIYLTGLSIIALTYDFSKSPVISFFIGLYLIDVMIEHKNKLGINKLLLVIGLIIIFYYVFVMDSGESIISIYFGPVGRILFSQIATLFLHFETFPLRYSFLQGSSFNNLFGFLFPNADSIRSGRIVMSLYNAKGIETNTAGVMNTLFIGEAYANFGIVGVVVAPIIFGIVIGLFSQILPSMKKTPTSVLLYIQLTLQFLTIIEGGFVDIFYNPGTIFLVAMTAFLYACSPRKVRSMDYCTTNMK